MAVYTKEFLVDAYMSRYIPAEFGISIESLETLERNAIELYDKAGRDQFRIYASLDADALKKFKLALASK